MGLELEVEVQAVERSKFAAITETVVKSFPEKFIILKQDCSINRVIPDDHPLYNGRRTLIDGVEIVTIPAGLQTHLKAGKALFENCFSTGLIDKSDRVGMHVHVNRNYVGFVAANNLQRFINYPKNKRKFIAVAGRSSSYAIYYDYDREGDQQNINCEKFSALNCGKEDTLEFRLCATPTTLEELKYRLEFIHSAVHYAKSDVFDRRWSKYHAWLFQQQRKYKSLKTFISQQPHPINYGVTTGDE
jgi:hypothetical protein